MNLNLTQTELTDGGTFRLIDALFELDGWQLVTVPKPHAVSVALVRRSGSDVILADFARGATAGAAALAAYERYRSIIPGPA